MSLPRWLIFLVAFWVLLWGGYRIHLGIRKAKRKGKEDPNRPNFRKKGLFASAPRRDILYGIIFVLLGGYLVAMGFGYYPSFGE